MKDGLGELLDSRQETSDPWAPYAAVRTPVAEAAGLLALVVGEAERPALVAEEEELPSPVDTGEGVPEAVVAAAGHETCEEVVMNTDRPHLKTPQPGAEAPVELREALAASPVAVAGFAVEEVDSEAVEALPWVAAEPLVEARYTGTGRNHRHPLQHFAPAVGLAAGVAHLAEHPWTLCLEAVAGEEGEQHERRTAAMVEDQLELLESEQRTARQLWCCHPCSVLSHEPSTRPCALRPERYRYRNRPRNRFHLRYDQSSWARSPWSAVGMEERPEEVVEAAEMLMLERMLGFLTGLVAHACLANPGTSHLMRGTSSASKADELTVS